MPERGIGDRWDGSRVREVAVGDVHRLFAVGQQRALRRIGGRRRRGRRRGCGSRPAGRGAGPPGAAQMVGVVAGGGFGDRYSSGNRFAWMNGSGARRSRCWWCLYEVDDAASAPGAHRSMNRMRPAAAGSSRRTRPLATRSNSRNSAGRRGCPRDGDGCDRRERLQRLNAGPHVCDGGPGDVEQVAGVQDEVGFASRAMATISARTARKSSLRSRWPPAVAADVPVRGVEDLHVSPLGWCRRARLVRCRDRGRSRSATAGGLERRRVVRFGGAWVQRPRRRAERRAPGRAASATLVAYGGNGNRSGSGAGISGWSTTIVPGRKRAARSRTAG